MQPWRYQLTSFNRNGKRKHIGINWPASILKELTFINNVEKTPAAQKTILLVSPCLV